MTWVRIDEEFARHPKVVAVGPLGMAMQVAGLCYCNQYLTDGFIPRAAAATLLSFDGIDVTMWEVKGIVSGGAEASWNLVASSLVDQQLWEEIPGGYLIHDYHDYQPTKAEVLELRKLRSEAGRKGGKASSRANPKQVLKPVPSNGSSRTEAKPKPVPVPVPVTSAVPLKTSSKAVTAELKHEVDKLIEALAEVDSHSHVVLLALARELPLSSVAKVRESCQAKRVGAGYAVNALRSEIAEREKANPTEVVV
jgi:hypothetical protein